MSHMPKGNLPKKARAQDRDDRLQRVQRADQIRDGLLKVLNSPTTEMVELTRITGVTVPGAPLTMRIR